MAVVNADNQCNEEGVQALHAIVSKMKPENGRQRIDVLTISAVFHASFGDATKVAQLLDDLVDLCRQVKHPVVRASLLRRASWGVCRFSPRHFAREVLDEAIDIFERLSLFKHLAPCLECLSVVDLQDGAYPAVEKTINRLHEISVLESDFFTRGIEYETRVKYAFEIGSRVPLENFDVPADVIPVFHRSTRGRLTIAALHLAHSLLQDEESDVINALAVAVDLRNELQGRCDQDFLISVITKAHLRLGLRSEAKEVLTDYLNYQRREPDYLLPSLVAIARELEIENPAGSALWDSRSESVKPRS
jgi:hypothetical protein